MRYGVISDIHSNLEAFQAVLDALSKDRIDEYLCVGDVVGYGADPIACIRLIRSLKPLVLIAGNHEWGVLGLTDLEYFNEVAKDAVIWTKNVLGHDELDFLKSFKLVDERDSFILVHGTLESPQEFNYILNGHDAYSTIKLMNKAICFIGHTHIAGCFYFDADRIIYSTEPSIKIDSNKKYVINVGSVGQPRDLDPRASYAIYDDEDDSVEIRRIEYDIPTAQIKILKAGLPQKLAYRLAIGQ